MCDFLSAKKVVLKATTKKEPLRSKGTFKIVICKDLMFKVTIPSTLTFPFKGMNLFVFLIHVKRDAHKNSNE